MNDPQIQDRRIVSLACRLTPDEIRERGEQAATLQHERDRIEDERQEANKARKLQIEGADKEIRQLLNEVRTRSVEREVEVIVRRNEAELTVETVRIDTGEVVSTRPMSPDERQVKLFPAGEDAVESASA